MKKTIGYLSLFIAICALLITSVGCSLFGPKDKTFSKAGLSITLTDDFTEQDLITQTAYYVSQNAIVTTLKEEVSVIGNRSVKEYAKLVCSVNKLDSTVTSKDGYAEFTFEKEVSGKDFYFYARCFKNGSDFWLVQFACETKDVDDYAADFEKWASSITFED